MLYLRGERDKETGLKFSQRIFLPRTETKKLPVLWAAADLLVIALTLLGLLRLMITGLSLTIPVWLYPLTAFVCVLSVLLCRTRWKRPWPIVWAFLVIIAFSVLLFIWQEPFLKGAQIFYLHLRQTLDATYHNGEEAQTILGAVNENGSILGGVNVNGAILVSVYETGVFLAFIYALGGLWLALSVLKKESFMMASLLLLPVIAALALSGAAINTPALFMLMFGVLGCYTLTRSVRHKRLWGMEHEGLYERNARRFQKIQKKNLLLVGAVAALLTIPGFYLVTPFLGVRLAPAERVAFRLQSRFLSKVLEVLPEISADQLNLEVEMVGGGVSDGSLGDTEGYNLQGVEDLRLTVSDQPKETIYLKGFIGTHYTGNAWESGYETTFDAAAMNWKTEGKARTYIRNLPFLRTAYILEKVKNQDTSAAKRIAGMSVEPSQISVERINANSAYTYEPYGAFVNDYYDILGGDGALAGQELTDDSFYFYYREDFEPIIESWNEIDGSESALDQLEKVYGYYCSANCMEIPEGLDALQERVDAAIKEQGLNPAFDRTEIISWVRAYLAENYTYDMDQPALEEGQDFLTNFLYETRSGYSIHFATAGAILFRMFGIPSRYVVGYEAPAAIFSVQSGGSYTATLQDDNSQAWVELYVSGLGWIPVDVTPGMVGTLEEVGAGGEKIQTFEYDKESLKEEVETETEQEDNTLTPQLVLEGATAWINRMLNTNMTVEQMIRRMTALVLGTALLIILLLTGRRICRSFGYDPLRRRTMKKRLLLMFAAYYHVLRKAGMPAETDSASEEFLEYASKYLAAHGVKSVEVHGASYELRQLRDDLYESCYGDRRVKVSDIVRMRKLNRQQFKCRLRHPLKKV